VTPEQKAAFVIAMAAQAMIEAIGMAADNQRAAAMKDPQPYLGYDFTVLIEKHGIHHNALITFFHE
jgi:hypothetical protein